MPYTTGANSPQYPLALPMHTFSSKRDTITYYARQVIESKKRMESFPNDRYFVLSYNDYILRLGYWLGEVDTDTFLRMAEYWHQERMDLLQMDISKLDVKGGN